MRVKWKLPKVLNVFNKQNVIENINLNMFLMKNYNIRNLIIPATLVNKRIYIYNGKFYDYLDITLKMVGHKIGEFSITKTLGRDFHLASEKKRKKKKNKNKKK